MQITNMDDKRIDEVLDGWDELLVGTEDFVWGEGILDQELFRRTMHKTWELFIDYIDFDAPDEKYALPIDLAVILGKVMSYAQKQQITVREDGGDIDVSAMIAEDLASNIRYRKLSRDEPVISKLKRNKGIAERWIYHLRSGELHIHRGDSAASNHFLPDSPDESSREMKNDVSCESPIVVSDISRWWDDV